MVKYDDCLSIRVHYRTQYHCAVPGLEDERASDGSKQQRPQ